MGVEGLASKRRRMREEAKEEGFLNDEGLRRILSSAMLYLLPPPQMLPSDWAEENINIPSGNAIAGPIRFRNAPHCREILDLAANPDVRKITLMWGAQTAKTTILNCLNGYYVGHDPQPQIVMFPSQSDLKKWRAQKLEKIFEASPTLTNLIAKPRGTVGKNNDVMITYAGGEMLFAWAGSPKTMRGISAPIIMCDEVDGYARTEEGHPVSLLTQRAATYGDDVLVVITSTPTIRRESFVEQSFLDGNRMYRHIPCPSCRTLHRLEWDNIHWRTTVDDETGEIIDEPETGYHECPHCQHRMTDSEKIVAARLGEWVETRPFKGHASAHISELYSTFRTWQQIIESYLEKKAQGDLQTFYNVSLAETYEEVGEQASYEALIERKELYGNLDTGRVWDVPMGGVVLTMGVDVQADRLELEVVAWGDGYESWSVRYIVINGDPDLEESDENSPWRVLNEVREREYRHESGAFIKVSSTCIDSSDKPDRVYTYVKGKAGRRVHAIKGVSGWGKPLSGAPSSKIRGKKSRRPVPLYPLCVDELKLLTVRSLNVQDAGVGYSHFPDRPEYDDYYFKMLTAEKLITRYVKGFPVRAWVKADGARNEAFDCRGYARAALYLRTPDPKWATFSRYLTGDGVASWDDDEPRHERPAKQAKATASGDQSPPMPENPKAGKRKKFSIKRRR